MDKTVFNDEDSNIVRLFERRQKIIRHNNICISEIVAYYENFIWQSILKCIFITDKIDYYDKIEKIVIDRITFMDKYKMLVHLAKQNKVTCFSQGKFEKFIELRNNISHNLSGVGEYNKNSKQHIIYVGGKEMLWDNYLSILNEWANISLEFASFIKEIYEKVEFPKMKFAGFHYCKIEGECIYVKHNLIYPDPKGEYISFADTGLDFDLLQLINEERELEKA